MKKPSKNRLLTDAFREISHTRSRFLSLMILSALAVCFLAGLRATAPDMKLSADRYFDQQQLMDLRVVSTLGLTQEDIQALAAQEGVDSAVGAYTVDALIKLSNNDYTVKVHSLSPEMNEPKVVEGRLPQRADECLVEPRLLQETGLQVGDVISLDTGTGTFADCLPDQQFTIVGAAQSPLYIGVERGASSLGTGKVRAFVLLPQDAFFLETYTDAYLTMTHAAAMETYSDEYEDYMEERTQQLEQLGKVRAPQRKLAVLDEANQKLADAQKTLDEERAKADKELSDAWGKLTDARKKLDQGWADYHTGLADYEAGKQELNDRIAQGQQEIADGEAELVDAKQELVDAEQKLTDARAQLDQGWQEYFDGYADYTDGLRSYAQGQTDYDAGKQKYADDKAEYERGLAQYQQGKRRLSDAAEQLSREQARYEAGLDQFETLLDTILLQTAMPLSRDELLAALRAEQSAAHADQLVTQGVNAMLSATLAQLDGGIAQGQQQLADLQGKLDAANQAIGQLPEAIQALEQAIAQAGQAGQDTTAMELQLAQYQTDLATAQAGQPALEQGVAQTQAALNGLEQQRAAFPTDTQTLLATHQTLEQGKAALAAGWADYSSGQADLRAASRKLDDAKVELADAKQELQLGRIKQMDGQYALTQAKADLEDALQQLQDGERAYAQGVADLEQGKLDYQDGVDKLAQARQDLADGQQEGELELSDAQVKLTDARKELDKGESEYRDGLAQYEDGKGEAELKLTDAQDQLDQARRDVSAIEDCKWYVLPRNTNMGYVSYSMDADRIGSLASVFPLIFFLVAALVCLTTMTRMVEEQRITIGGMKALGYSKGAIAIKYVGYGFLASALGSLLGLAVGLTLLPWIICTAWGIIYAVGETYYSLEPATSAMAALAAVGTVTLSALVACFSTLTAVPAQLMRPKAPPMGKRILLERMTWVWRRLSFHYKVTLRNLFRYKKRFWMTVIGIGGCAGLIVTAFGLRDSIFDIMDRQFDQLYTYTAQVGLVDQVTAGELRQVEEFLEQNDLVLDAMTCRSESVTARTDAYSVDSTLQIVPDREEFGRFVDLRRRLDGQPVQLAEDGVVLTEKLAKLLDVGAGDTFTLEGDTRVQVRVADVTEHYIQHYIYMTDSYYQTLFGQPPQSNMVLVDAPAADGQLQTLAAGLVALDGVTTMTLLEDTRTTFSSSLESVDYAVALIIVCAAALAFVVLYNLTNINITERLRELATLKVLGFYNGELGAYVYRENVILTVFGVGLGMVLGKLLHQWLILTVEIDMLMFGRTLHPNSYVYAVLLTVVFSALVNLAAHKKLKKLDMVQSLKTVE